MKKPLLTGTIVIVAILIGFSTLLIQNNDDVKINDIDRSNSYSEKITITNPVFCTCFVLFSLF